MQIEVLKIRNTIYEVIDTFFRFRDFYEVAPPILTPFSCENACVGGSDLISVNYYDEKAFLSQSGQLYLEALAMKLGRVYCVNPAFRAESTLLATHLSEFWMCEAEMLDVTMNDLIQCVNDLLLAVIRTVLERNVVELKVLGTDIVQFERFITKPFPQITYSEAIDILRKYHISLAWGEDIQPCHELVLSEHLNNVPFFVTMYPQTLSSFYKKRCSDNPELTLTFDVIAPNGFRELVGGSMREIDVEKLRKSLLMSGTDLSPYKWYLDMISSNPKSHGGFGLGIERLVSWICNLSTIQEAIPFPRTEEKLWP